MKIKFRVWDKKKSEMIGVSALSIIEVMFMPDNIDYNDFFNYDNQFYSDLMQYTGLKDRDGIEIYEGDILTTECTEIIYTKKPNVHGLYAKTKTIKTTGKVKCVWKSYGFKFEHMRKTKQGINISSFKVIGNIYENPELLETRDER